MSPLDNLPPPESLPADAGEITAWDLFAAAALVGVLSNEEMMVRQFSGLPSIEIKDELADLCRRQANAMMKVRPK